MAINLNGKAGEGLAAAIAAAGHWMRMHNNVLVCSDETAVQAIVNAYDLLSEQKATRVLAIKLDGLARINMLFPAIDSLDEIAFYAEFWTSIAPAARAATTNFQRIINIYTAAKNAVTAVNAATTKAQIDAVSPAWPA